MLDLIAAAGIGGIIGFGTCAFLTIGKVADGDIDRENDAWAAGYDSGYKNGLRDDAHEMGAAHTRCADALTTCQRKLSAIRDIVGPTEGLRRGRMGQILAVLDGERK